MKEGLIAINALNRVINASTGEEISPMFKRGDMKKIFEAAMIKTPTVVSISVVTLEENSVYDRENDIRTDEKQLHDDILQRRLRLCLNDEHVIPSPPFTESHDTITEKSPHAIIVKSTTIISISDRKLKLASELNQVIEPSVVDETNALSIKHVFAAAPDVAEHIRCSTPNHRVSVNAIDDENSALQDTVVNVASASLFSKPAIISIKTSHEHNWGFDRYLENGIHLSSLLCGID